MTNKKGKVGAGLYACPGQPHWVAPKARSRQGT